MFSVGFVMIFLYICNVTLVLFTLTSPSLYTVSSPTGCPTFYNHVILFFASSHS
jgi:hypothetical protein